MKPNHLPIRRALGAIAMLSALLLLSPGSAEAKGQNFRSSGGGYQGSFHGGGKVARMGRGSQSLRGGKMARSGRGSQSLRGGKKSFGATKFRKRHRRRSNIITHGTSWRRNIFVHDSFGRTSLHKRNRYRRFHRNRLRGNRVAYYDNYGSSYGPRRTRYENIVVVPQAEAAPAPQETPARPFEPKIIDIVALPGNDDGSIALAPQPGTLSKQASNCLSVKRQIIVDGQAMEAFGKACMEPDGSWTLSPDG